MICKFVKSNWVFDVWINHDHQQYQLRVPIQLVFSQALIIACQVLFSHLSKQWPTVIFLHFQLFDGHNVFSFLLPLWSSHLLKFFVHLVSSLSVHFQVFLFQISVLVLLFYGTIIHLQVVKSFLPVQIIYLSNLQYYLLTHLMQQLHWSFEMR